MKIILFRHGDKQKPTTDSFSDRKNVVLSPVGIDQVTKLGHILKTRFPELQSSQFLFSSPYLRTIQSAQIVQSIIGIKEISLVPEFHEFCPVQDFFQAKDIRDHLYSQCLIDPDWVSPETHTSFNMAVSVFETKIKEICRQTSDQTILISSHGGIIRSFAYHLDPKLRPSNNLIAKKRIHTAGYTVLNFDGQQFSVDQFDVHDHLI